MQLLFVRDHKLRVPYYPFCTLSTSSIVISRVTDARLGWAGLPTVKTLATNAVSLCAAGHPQSDGCDAAPKSRSREASLQGAATSCDGKRVCAGCALDPPKAHISTSEWSKKGVGLGARCRECVANGTEPGHMAIAVRRSFSSTQAVLDKGNPFASGTFRLVAMHQNV